jgi:ketosteroid isomerase-like protein
MVPSADDLESAVSDARAGVAAANASFYAAFEALDLARMDAVWARGEHVRCVHPGWPLLTGWTAVRDSWAAIFANTEEMRFTLSDVHVLATGEMGVVTCTENILSGVGGRIGVTSVLATNAFERGPDGWRMILHHASHVLAGRE